MLINYVRISIITHSPAPLTTTTKRTTGARRSSGVTSPRRQRTPHTTHRSACSSTCRARGRAPCTTRTRRTHSRCQCSTATRPCSPSRTPLYSRTSMIPSGRVRIPASLKPRNRTRTRMRITRRLQHMVRARCQAPPLRTRAHLGSMGNFTRRRNRCSSSRARSKIIGGADAASVRYGRPWLRRKIIMLYSRLHIQDTLFASYWYFAHTFLIHYQDHTWTVSIDSLHTWHLSPFSSSLFLSFGFYIFNLHLTAPNQTFRTILHRHRPLHTLIHSILPASILLYTSSLTSPFLA